MFALLVVMASTQYYLGRPHQYPSAYGGQYGQHGFGPQPGFPLDPRGLSVFTDGIDAKPAGMFIAAGMDPKYLPMSTDGYDAGDAWIYGIPNMSSQDVINRAKGMYPMSAQLHHPENEELAREWAAIVANGLLVVNGQTGGTAGTAGTGTVDGSVINSGTANSGTTSSDPEGTVVLQSGLYTVLQDGQESSGLPEGSTVLTPGTYRVQAANPGTVVHYPGEEYEGYEQPETEYGGVLLSRPHDQRAYYHGCAPEDWVIGFGCVQNLRMRTPFLAKPQWRRKL